MSGTPSPFVSPTPATKNTAERDVAALAADAEEQLAGAAGVDVGGAVAGLGRARADDQVGHAVAVQVVRAGDAVAEPVAAAGAPRARG